jgi:DNA-binding transcriptional regulator YiaG
MGGERRVHPRVRGREVMETIESLGMTQHGTSGGGAMRADSSMVHTLVLLGSLLLGTEASFASHGGWEEVPACGVIGTTSAGTPCSKSSAIVLATQPPESTDAHERQPILELRRLSGLSWEQLSRVCGVTPRTLHFWASGKQMSMGHEERTARLLATMRRIYRGHASATRRALLSSDAGGPLPFDLLADGRFSEVEALLGVERVSTVESKQKGQAQESELYRPLPVSTVLGALHGSVHKEGKGSRRVRARRKG